jgi:hypothetical protein
MKRLFTLSKCFFRLWCPPRPLFGGHLCSFHWGLIGRGVKITTHLRSVPVFRECSSSSAYFNVGTDTITFSAQYLRLEDDTLESVCTLLSNNTIEMLKVCFLWYSELNMAFIFNVVTFSLTRDILWRCNSN